MSWIELKGMIFHAFHGVSAQERKVGTVYTVDLKFELDIQKAAETDHLSDTVNYASIYAIVKEEMAIPSNLIEHVALRIVQHIQTDFPQIKTVEIRLAKQNPPFGGDIREVAVVIGFIFQKDFAVDKPSDDKTAYGNRSPTDRTVLRTHSLTL